MLSEKRRLPPPRSYRGSVQAVVMLTMATSQDRLLVFILLISLCPHASLASTFRANSILCITLSFLTFWVFCFTLIDLFLGASDKKANA